MRLSVALRPLALASICATSLTLCSAQTASSGALLGTLVDPAGVPVANASLGLSQPGSQPRTAVTGPEGSFTLRDLPSGTYTLHAEAPGFPPSDTPSVVIATGRTTHLSVRLNLPTSQQSVTVTATQLSFDPSQTSSVINIDRDRVEELPIPNRNYLTFALLSPQVMASNPALGLLGPAANVQGFSFGGLRPQSNAVYVDSVNDNDEYTGGSRTELSPEAINDFQIVNHGFAAQSGGGAGGSIDVQTRAGINDLHGDAFVFVQNGALNGTPPLGLFPRRPDETRIRGGLALGGPIQQNRTYYYAAAEQEQAWGQDTNDLRPATLTTINNALHTIGPLSATTLSNSFFPTSEHETELSARIDRGLSARHSLMLRYALTNARNVGEAFNTLELADSSARGSRFTADNSLNTTLTSTFAGHAVNQLSAELAQRRAVDRTSSTSGPGILIPGVALFGTPWSGNTRRYETHIELADSVSITQGHHLLTSGARADIVRLRADLRDGSQGFFVFPSLAALQTGTASFFSKAFGNTATNLIETRYAAFAQDHWSAARSLTIDAGLRYEYNHLPSQLPQDALNIAPRLGLAWTPYKSLVVRTGAGLFYDRFQLATINRLLSRDGTHSFDQILEDADAATFYRTGSVLVTTVPGVAPSPSRGAPSIWRAASTLRNPYSEVASLSAEQSLPFQTTLTAEYHYVRGARLGRTRNVNLTAPTLLTPTNAGALGFTNPTPQSLNRLVFSPLRNDPRYDAINQFETQASSTYHAGTVTLNRQFAENFELLAGYTFSKTLDDASADFEQPQNPFAPADERALSLNDQRHRLTLSGLYLIGPDLDDPADAAANANPGPLMRALTGFEIAPILSISSGFHQNPTTGVDSTHQHIYPFAARPQSLARNSLTTPAQINFDLRILRIIPFGPAHLDLVAESFNLLNHPNVSLLQTAFGTNTTPQPGFGSRIETASPRRIQFSLDYEF